MGIFHLLLYYRGGQNQQKLILLFNCLLLFEKLLMKMLGSTIKSGNTFVFFLARYILLNVNHFMSV